MNANDINPIPNPLQDGVHQIAHTDELVHLISIGTLEHGCTLHDLLLDSYGLKLSVITDCAELWEIPQGEVIHLAILHETLSQLDLDEATHVLRRRWPQCQILVIRSGEGFLEDALYDERISPSTDLRTLLVHIEGALDRSPCADRIIRSRGAPPASTSPLLKAQMHRK